MSGRCVGGKLGPGELCWGKLGLGRCVEVNWVLGGVLG